MEPLTISGNKQDDLERVKTKIVLSAQNVQIADEQLEMLKLELEILQNNIAQQILTIDGLKRNHQLTIDQLQEVEHAYAKIFIWNLPVDVLKIIVSYCNYSCGDYIGRLARVSKQFYSLVNLLRTSYCVKHISFYVHLSKALMPACKNVVIDTWNGSEHEVYDFLSFMKNNVNNAYLEVYSSRDGSVSFDFKSQRSIYSRLSHLRGKIDQNVVRFFKPTMVQLKDLEDIKEYVNYIKTVKTITFVIGQGTVIINNETGITLNNISRSKLKSLKLFPGVTITYETANCLK